METLLPPVLYCAMPLQSTTDVSKGYNQCLSLSNVRLLCFDLLLLCPLYVLGIQNIQPNTLHWWCG